MPCILRDLLVFPELRKQLQPYIIGLFNASTAHGDPIMRPLAYDFEDDPQSAVHTATDAYMFGPRLLAAPVTDLGARSRVSSQPTFFYP